MTASVVRVPARKQQPEAGLAPAVAVALDFDAIYQAHAQAVARWVARLSGPGADVEDLAQEVFLVVARRLAEFRRESQVSTWLFAIAARIVANDRRRRRLRRWWLRLVPGFDDHPAPGTNSPADNLDRVEQQRRFYEILDRLPERQRRAFVLFELEELHAPEVAGLMGLTEGNARVLLHRARAAFVRHVAERDRRDAQEDQEESVDADRAR